MKHFLIVEITHDNKTYYTVSGKTLKSAFIKELKENPEFFGWSPEEFFDNVRIVDGKWQLSDKRVRQYAKYILDSMLNINDDQYMILDITDAQSVIEIKEGVNHGTINNDFRIN